MPGGIERARADSNRFRLILGGLLVGAVIGGVAGWLERDSPESSVVSGSELNQETTQAAAEFVVVWEQSRTATYLATSRLERTTDTGGVLELPLVVAQRPPDRVVSTGAGVDGTVEEHQIVCDEHLDGALHCQDHNAMVSYEEALADEMAVLRGYLAGDQPLYRVSRDGWCFDLRLTRAVHAPPYGQRARFCFDEATKAPSLRHIERREGTDVVTLLSVQTEVSDADLARIATGNIEASLQSG